MKLANGIKRIGRFFAFLTDRLYRGIATGPLGRLFGSYEAMDARFHQTAMVRAMRPRHRKYGGTTLRGNVAMAMDQSAVRRAAHSFTDGFLRCSLRTVGAFFLTGGIYSALITWLIFVVWQRGTPNGFHVFLSFVVAAFGVILLFSDRSVGHAVYKSRLMGALLHSSLGVSDDSVKRIPEKGKPLYAVAVPLGMLLGSITALTGPLYPALAILLLSVLFVVLTTPEAGVVLLLIFAPFSGFLTYGELCLALIVVLSGIGYFCKLLRGTRAFHMEIQDFVMLLLLISTLLTGVSAAGGSAMLGACLSALLIFLYFPAVNILATPTWLMRCRWGLLFSATVTAIIGILQFLINLILTLQGTRVLSMDHLGSAVRAGFSNNAIFAYFMVLAFPFTLHAFLRARNASHRITAGLSCVAVLAATVLTWSQSAWLALLAEILVLALICKKECLIYLLIGMMLFPILLLVLPEYYRVAFFTFFGSGDVMTGGSLAAKLYFEGGSGFFGVSAGLARMLFGLGMDGLERVAVLYVGDFAASLSTSLSFWWVRLFEGGILGILLPAAFLFFLLQNCFSVLPHDSNTQSAVAPASGIAMVAGVLLLSAFHYAWRDPAALLLFIALCAIITADARNRRSLYVRNEVVASSATFAQMEYALKAGRKKNKKEVVADEHE